MRNSVVLLLFSLIASCIKTQKNGSINQSDVIPNDCIKAVDDTISLEILDAASIQLENWKTQKRRFFNNVTIADQKLESTIFFDPSDKKFFLAVLQLGKEGGFFDAARIIRGTVCENGITFSIGMEIAFERDEQKTIPDFDQLKKRYLKYVYRQGDPSEECKIDPEYWFAENADHPKCE